MIVIIKPDSTWEELSPLLAYCQSEGVDVQETFGYKHRMFSLLGDTSQLDIDRIMAYEAVQDAKRLQPPYRKSSRLFHPETSVIQVGSSQIGGGAFLMIAGPCSVESEAQISSIAALVKQAGAHALRGGAFKPRSSPYTFQGMQKEGIRLLLLAGKSAGLPVVSEIMETSQLPLFEDVDIIQVGARNMQNYELLKELSHCKKPIILKRGLSSTYEELLSSAEYLMAGGNGQIILCERGIRTFESQVRSTPDICAVPVLHALSHLPVIVDPSHSTGRRDYVPSVALAAAAANADGLMIEVHNDPEHALCDGQQALTPDAYHKLYKQVMAVRRAIAD